MKNHIEFLGLPGSGKSTLYNKIINQKYDNLYSLEKAIDLSTKRAILNYQSNNKLKMTYRYIIYQLTKNFIYPVYKSNRFIDEEYRNYLVGNPGVIKKILDLFNEFNLNIDEKKKLYTWLDRLIAEYSLIKEYLSDNESVVIDEGFVHFSTSIWQRKKPFDNKYYLIEDYIKVVSLPEVLMYINVEPKEAYNRMLKRGRFPGPYKNLSKEDCVNKLLKMKLYIEYLLRLINNDVNIIKINNHSSIDKSFIELKNNLDKYF